MADDSLVYFVRGGDFIKIGCSRQPLSRITSFAEWVPFKLELLATTQGGFDLECRLHSYFDSCRVHGEWFKPNAEMIGLVDSIRAGRGIETDIPPVKRGTTAQKEIKRLTTKRVSKAERMAGLGRPHYIMPRQRPQYIVEAIASYQGIGNGPPSKNALASITKYEKELEAGVYDHLRKIADALDDIEAERAA